MKFLMASCVVLVMAAPSMALVLLDGSDVGGRYLYEEDFESYADGTD